MQHQEFTIVPYQELPTSPMYLRLEDWESFVKDIFPKRYGVVWNKYKTYPQGAWESRHKKWTLDDELEPSLPPLKKRQVYGRNMIWRFTFECHRAGEKRVQTDRPNGGSSGQKRPVQKSSKKIGCQAQLSVAYYSDNADYVEIDFKGIHIGHTIGGPDDMRFLPISAEITSFIMDRLREGYKRRDVRRDLQRKLGSFDEQTNVVDIPQHRDQLLPESYIYNLWRQVQLEQVQKDPDEKQSVLLWLGALETKGFSVHIDPDFDETLIFGFCSPWQKSLLSTCRTICLDATHHVSRHHLGILYSVVIKHPETGTGCPVGYLFTLDHSAAPLEKWVFFLRELGLSPWKMTIDCSYVELNALQSVFPRIPIQWCTYHVGQAVWKALQTRVKLQKTEESKRLRSDMMQAFKEMMYTKDEENFHRLHNEFVNQFAEQKQFIDYYVPNWYNEGRFTRWCAAFQPDISTNMETNNFVESWHNQLKTWYFERRRNRRLDTLIAVLVEDVDYDMQATRQIRSLNIGRMTANERERRKREIRAEAIALPILKDMVDMISSTGGPAPVIHVASFRQADDVAYDIHLQGKIMLSCSCRDFVYRRSPCKHMFAARRVDENLQFRESPGAQGPAVQEVEEPMDTPIAEEGIEEQIEPADFLMDMTNSIKSLADQAGNDRQLQEVVRNGLRRIQGELLQVEGSRGSTLPPNVHFQRQKR